MPTKDLKVVIVGGSIAGLLLANALARQGIDFIVLEGRSEVAPCDGAGLCILSSGARILDQLGIFEDIQAYGGPISVQRIWRDDGQLLGHTETLALIPVRQGYPVIFVERQRVLQVLFEHLPDTKRVLLGKKVIDITASDDQAIVKCLDGTNYEADIIVGADGIHSITRRKMIRDIISNCPQSHISHGQLGRVFTAQYAAVFGLSRPTPGMKIGHCNRTFADGFSFFNAVGRKGQIFWFLFRDMGKVYSEKDIPRFDQNKIEEDIAPFLNKYVAEGVRFQDIFKNRVRCAHVPIEEGFLTQWAWGRYACIGDSVHKTTPNLGQGGNGAIESAASLANTIVSIAHSVKLESLSVPEISASLDEWARSRQRRMKLICDLGNSFTRLEAFHTLKDKALGLYLGKYQVDAIADILCDTTVGAEKLSFLPLPEKSAHVTMPFDPEKGIHAAPRVRSLMLRALLPFILIFAVQPTVRGFMNSRILKPVSISYEHEAEAFDFLGYDINYQSIQALAAMSRIADLGAILGIWALESCRTGNVATLMSL
ncbi:FAD/NAD(P)-binding domain-containing protein [Aspergillus welwitschiae]|uniref:FAD/NAD(P)-binding domain-containing protein n=1 Tax=Aspergillus welwitschiae TaxID=1341132 RepID=A0A3F3PQK0_9EURO|nr:FAD/NAD(P)-binding domain-containing protein [Aspergillus welwitschiae]RDH29022.1 FAD/NAD(P)-binding domain-containing protein [Aspergillus welwitschiae]